VNIINIQGPALYEEQCHWFCLTSKWSTSKLWKWNTCFWYL